MPDLKLQLLAFGNLDQRGQSLHFLREADKLNF